MKFYRFHYYSIDFYILSVSALPATTLHSIIKSLAKLYLYSHNYISELDCIHYFDALSSTTITPLKKALSSMSGTNSRTDDRAFYSKNILSTYTFYFITYTFNNGVTAWLQHRLFGCGRHESPCRTILPMAASSHQRCGLPHWGDRVCQFGLPAAQPLLPAEIDRPVAAPECPSLQ